MTKERYAKWLAETGCRSVRLLSIEQPGDLAEGIITLVAQRDRALALLRKCHAELTTGTALRRGVAGFLVEADGPTKPETGGAR